MSLEGNIGSTLRRPVLGSFFAERLRYRRPVMAAKADWTVLRKMEYVKRSFLGPWVVVVNRSWIHAQVMLSCCQSGSSNPIYPRAL